MHRVGIIPFDLCNGAIRVLFVTSRTRGRWILPKGKLETGERHVDACHREGFEEAGVRGHVLEDFPSTVLIDRLTANGLEKVPVTYYPYLVTQQLPVWPEQALRRRQWSPLEDAFEMAHRDDYADLLQQFDALRAWILDAATRLRHDALP